MTTAVTCVVTDSNVLINMMHVSRLWLLGRIPGREFVVPDHVREEITAADQREALDVAIDAGAVRLEPIVDLDALVLFSELIVHIGRGEAACIALAASKDWWIASDESAASVVRRLHASGRPESWEHPSCSWWPFERDCSRSTKPMQTSSCSSDTDSRCDSTRFESCSGSLVRGLR